MKSFLGKLKTVLRPSRAAEQTVTSAPSGITTLLRKAAASGGSAFEVDNATLIEKVDVVGECGRGLSAPTASPAEGSGPTTTQPGRYIVGNAVAHGGMGAILHARDLNLRRTVAMKVILPEKETSEQHRLRFVQEAQLTAQLEHPNIVPVHELGNDEQGKSFYTMKFVKGITLHDVLEKIKAGDAETIAVFSLAHLLTIFQKVCDAVAFAHSRGVVHRDLKPENIMLGDYGEVLVMDWGLAKVVTGVNVEHPTPKAFASQSASNAEHRTLAAPGDHPASSIQHPESGLTMSGQILGSPQFMSPEQAEGKVDEIDARSDMFALGGILYNILTLHPPVSGKSVVEIIEKIRSGDIEPPTAFNPRSSSVGGRLRRATGSGSNLPARSPVGDDLPHCPGGRIPQSLSSVCMKALALKPESRYQTVPELQRDIEAYQAGFATAAEQAGIIKQIWLLIKRHRTVFFVSLTALLVLIVSAIGFMIKVRAEKNRAEQRLIRLHVENGLRLMEEGNLMMALPWFVEALKLDRGNPEREELHRIRLGLALRQCPKLVQIWFHDALINDAQFSPSGSRLVTASRDQTARIWDTRTGELVARPLPHEGSVYCASFSPDGRRVITGATWVSATSNAAARVWHTTTGEPVTDWLSHSHSINDVAFSPDGRWVATACTDKTARVWDAATGQPITQPLPHSYMVWGVAFSPDGKRLVTAGPNARLWDIATGQDIMLTESGENGKPKTAEFSPDGARIVTAGESPGARIWDATTGKLAAPLPHAGYVLDAEFSPDGRFVATAGEDKTALIWNAADGTPVQLPRRHGGPVNQASFSPDSRLLVTASSDGTARVWDVANLGRSFVALAHGGAVLRAFFHPDGGQVLTVSKDKTVRLWDVSSMLPVPAPTLHKQQVSGASFSPDGKSVLTWAGDGTARVWDAATRQPITPPLEHGNWLSARFSPDGRRVVTSGGDQPVRVWDAGTGALVCPPLAQTNVWGQSLAFSRDGRRIFTAATARDTAEWRVWDAATGELLRKHTAPVKAVTFSPDGQSLILLTTNQTLQMHDVDTGQPIHSPVPHRSRNYHLAFSFDGRYFLRNDPTRGNYNAQVFDAVNGKPVGLPLVHGDYIACLSFSRDGRRVLTGSHDGTARVWDAMTGQPITPPLKHAAAVDHAVFSPDGRRLATASADAATRIWDAATGEPITPPLVQGRGVRGLDFSPDGRRLLIADESEPATRIVELSPDPRPITDLAMLSQFFSAREIDSTGGLVPLASDRLRSAWETLRARYPADFQLSTPSPLMALKMLQEQTGLPGKISLGGDGLLRFDAANTVLRDLTPLHGARISFMDLTACPVTDLSPLEGMPLRELHLGLTPVTDLRPLRGMPLEYLDLNGTKISDLSPLHGLPLRSLYIGSPNVTDLSPLRGMPLENLLIWEAHITDLGPLQGRSLKFVEMRGCPVSDLSPLRGHPIHSLALAGLPVTDLGPLRGMPLQRLDLRDAPVSDLSPLAGLPLEWLAVLQTKVTDLGPLKGMPLRELNIHSAQVADLSPLAGMPMVELNLAGTQVADLSPLRGMPLVQLGLKMTRVTNLDALRGSPLKVLDLTATDITDLNPLRGLPLRELRLEKCANLTDLTPLADCKDLELLDIPPQCQDLEALRGLPKLKRLTNQGTDVAGWDKAPTAAEFWKQYDAKKGKGQ